jgi:hypothetical protein
MKLQAIHTGVIVKVEVVVATKTVDKEGNHPVIRESGDTSPYYKAEVVSIGNEVTEVEVGDIVRIPFDMIRTNAISSNKQKVIAETSKQELMVLIDHRQIMYKEV